MIEKLRTVASNLSLNISFLERIKKKLQRKNTKNII